LTASLRVVGTILSIRGELSDACHLSGPENLQGFPQPDDSNSFAVLEEWRASLSMVEAQLEGRAPIQADHEAPTRLGFVADEQPAPPQVNVEQPVVPIIEIVSSHLRFLHQGSQEGFRFEDDDEESEEDEEDA
jgi:hypothetical protein